MPRGAIILSLLCCTWLDASSQEPSRSRLVVVGDVSSVLVGQESYCGKMDRVEQDDLQKISVRSENRTWVRFITGSAFTATCTLDFSFTPEAGQSYIARYTLLRGACQVELFRIRPGLAPTTARLTPEASRSCLLQ
jgi:hypothetical protein